MLFGKVQWIVKPVPPRNYIKTIYYGTIYLLPLIAASTGHLKLAVSRPDSFVELKSQILVTFAKCWRRIWVLRG